MIFENDELRIFCRIFPIFLNLHFYTGENDVYCDAKNNSDVVAIQ